ncbi:MAG: autotransporter domain-containing protein [Alphaproteobacteria bacterium]|nr:autotransporter domain-containing protein [Alphaproteobacteria bacterium]MBU2379337.1 autotransporter domain-containing protein [Alphaproteobacteria bacterium]
MLVVFSPAVAQAACTINISLPANTAAQPSAVLTDAWDANCFSATTAGFAGPVVPGFAPANGVVDFENRQYTTQFRYTPALNFVGTDSFRLQGDQMSGAGAGIVIVNVTIAARAPVTADAPATVAYNSISNVMPLTFSGVAPASVQVVGAAAHGASTVSGTSILYTPTTGFAGADSFTYQGMNAGGTSNLSTISITVTPPPPPVANAYTALAVSYDAGGGGTTTFSLAGQASNGPTSYAVGSAATANGGQVSIDASGLVTYRPATGYRGNDTFTYTATNPGGTSSPATVTVPVADPVLAASLTGTGAKAGVALSGYAIIASGGRGPYSCATAVASGGLPAGVSLNADCTLSGTPMQSGAFTFANQITDSSLGLGPFIQVVPGFSISVQLATPTVAINSPAQGAALSTYDVTVSGSATNATSVTVAFQGTNYGPVAVTGDAWSQTLPGALSNGAYSVTVVSTNGVEDSAAATSGFTVAVAAPAAPVIATPTAGQVATTQTPVVSGSAAANTRVTVREGATVLATPMADGAGDWSATSAALGQGAHTITATAADVAGNTSAASAAVSFTVDTIGPPAPVIAAPVAGQLLTTATPTLSGTAEPGATVTVRDGATVVATTTASGGGGWSATSATLGQGSHTLTATARDAAGNTGPASTSVSFTIDTDVPQVPTITTPVDNSSTTQTTPTYSGMAEAGATVTVFVDGTSIGATSADGSGDWSKAQAAGLSLGAHTVRATAADAAGNVSASSATIGFTVVAAPIANARSVTTAHDTAVNIKLTGSNATSYATTSAPAHGALSGTAPNLIYTPVSGYSGADSFQFTASNAAGVSAPATVSIVVGAALTVSVTAPTDGAIIANPESVTITGAAGNATSVSLTVNGVAYGPIPVTNGGWSQVLSPSRLPDGVYAVSAVSSDGTSQSAPTTASFTVAGPSVALVSPADGAVVSDPDAVTVSGTAANASSVTLTVNGTAYGPITVTGGTWSQTLSPSRLPNGAYAVSVVSGSGGVSSLPATANFTVAGPTVAIVSPAEGAVVGPDITVTGEAAYATSVTLTFQGVAYGPIPVGGGVWSQALPAGLNGGAYALTAVSSNGGVSSATATSSFNVALSTDSTLAGLTLSEASLSPAFSASTTVYSASVANSVAAITLVPTVSESNARVSVNGSNVASGGSSGPISLVVGANPVIVTVTAQSGAASTYTITINRLSPAPTAAGVEAGVAYDSPGQTITLQPGGDFASTSLATAPTHGVATIAGTTATYVPTPGYSGVDSFAYVATGPGGVSQPATVRLTIAPPDAPVAAAVTGATPFDSTGTEIALSASGVYSSLTLATGPAHGAVSIAGTTATYVPTRGYFGADSFTYVATGPGGTSVPATVSLTIAPPNAPVAEAVTASAPFDSTGTEIALSASGVYSSLTVATGPTHGVVTIAGTKATYVPTRGYSGADGFTYVATGPGGVSGPATVSIIVGTPAAPAVAAVTATAPFDSAGQAITLEASGVFTALTVATAPAHGAVSIAGTTATYVPSPGYFGADSFTYVATGPGGTSAPATVSIIVGTPAAPAVAAVMATAPFDSAGQAIALEPSGVFTALTVATPPAHGAVSIAGTTATYVPSPGYSGADSFTYVATGPGGTSAPATVSLTVATPPPPVIAPPPATTTPTTTNGSGTATVELGASTSGAVTGYRVSAEGQYGSAIIVATTTDAMSGKNASALAEPAQTFRLIYTPRPDFMGADTVTLVAFGPGGESAPATFTFHVPGKAPDLSARTTSDSSVALRPTAGLAGGPFQGLRITRSPSFGTATVQGLTLVFTPGMTQGGATSLDYVVQLPFGESEAGRIDLTSSLSPTAPDRTARTIQGRSVTVRITDGAQGGPFSGATISRVAPANSVAAQVVVAGPGAYDITVTPEGTFSGEALVTYSLSNASGTATGTVTVTVEARPDPALNADVRALAGGQVQAARRFANGQIDNVQQRLSQLHRGDNPSANGLRINLGQDDAQRDPRTAAMRRLGAADAVPPGDREAARERELIALSRSRGEEGHGGEATSTGAPDLPGARLAHTETGRAAGDHDVGVWTSGSIDWGRQDASGARDNRFTTQGVTVGADVALTPSVTVGAAGGYGEDATRVGVSDSRSRATAVSGMVYGSWRPVPGFYLDGMAGYSGLSFESRRWAEGLGGEPDAFARGSRSGDLAFLSAAAGRTRDRASRQSDVYARVDARRIGLDGFVETGAGLASLQWDAVTQDSLSASLGASLRWLVQTRRYGRIAPEVRLEWSHEFEGLNDQAVRYADWTASPRYLATLDGWSRDAVRLNMGGEWSLNDGMLIRLGYRGSLGDGGQSHGAELGFKLNW